jgi:hypothetical protein
MVPAWCSCDCHTLLMLPGVCTGSKANLIDALDVHIWAAGEIILDCHNVTPRC